MRAHRAAGGDAGAPVAPDEPAQPGGVLLRRRAGRDPAPAAAPPICSAVAVGPTSSSAGSPGASRRRKNISVTTPSTTARPLSARRSKHGAWVQSSLAPAAAVWPRAGSHDTFRRASVSSCRSSLLACSPPAGRPPTAAAPPCCSPPARISRASIRCSPLHPLARQVQRYVLLTTLARYDSALVPAALPRAGLGVVAGPAGADLPSARRGVRWHDGGRRPRAMSPGRSTRRAIPATGYPRTGRARRARAVDAPDDSTVALAFQPAAAALSRRADRPRHPAGAPARHGAARRVSGRRPGTTAPVGNGPFRFVSHEPNRRWVFAANPATSPPRSAGRPRSSGSSSWWWTSRPPSSPRSPRASSTSPASSRPTPSSWRATPALAVLSYPLLLTYGIVFNTRRPPFDRLDGAGERSAMRSTGGRSSTATSTASARRHGPGAARRAGLSSGAASTPRR